jgi:hypothetical protein
MPKITAVDPIRTAVDDFLEAHERSFEIVVDGVPRIMTRTEVRERWPRREWWLAVESLCDELVEHCDEVKPWQLRSVNLLLREVLLNGLNKERACYVPTLVTELSTAVDNSDYVRHETVEDLFEIAQTMPGAVEFLHKLRGCTREQATKIVNLYDKYHRPNPNYDAAALEAELAETCVWPQDKAAKEREETGRKTLADLAHRWTKRPRFAATDQDDYSNSLSAIVIE